jgi:uncharacterized protein HemX
MISKILLTLFVILVAWLVIRQRQQRMQVIAQQAAPAQPAQGRNNYWKWAGYLLVVVMILGSALFLYGQWQERNQVVRVQVIDSLNGNRNEYRALRTDVRERGFRTLDGREVTVADTERIELLPER